MKTIKNLIIQLHKNQFKLFYQYFIILLGFMVIISYIWFRFIRKRVPRNIPFSLLVISFLLICVSVSIYLYVIFKLFKPSKINPVVEEITSTLMQPLEAFDQFLKKYFSYKDILIYIYKKITKPYLFYLLTNILPRVITISALALDVFIFHKFYYIYKVLLISAIPLITRYYIYSLNKIKDLDVLEYSSQIGHISTPYVFGVDKEVDEESIEDGIFPDVLALSLEQFIKYQTICILDNVPVEYNVFRTEEIYTEYKIKFNITKLNSEHFAIIRSQAKIKIETILKLAVFIANYKQTCILYKSLRNIKATIFLLYVTTWSYVVFLIAPYVKWITGLISLIHSLSFIEDPFSGQLLFNDLLTYVIDNQDLFIIDIISK